MRAFTRAPGGPIDTNRAGRIPALHTPDFAATPATVVSGPDPGEAARRATTIAANARADAAIRSSYCEDRRGLRGGRFSVDGKRLTLRDVLFAGSARVNGTGRFDYARGAYGGTFTVGGTRVQVAWTQATPAATAKVGGAELSLPAL